ncbi:DNA repair ATPase [Actinosynnema sp. NPDC059797]
MTLEAGTYEVLRARLAEQAAGLARRAEALNARRLEVFGSAELALLGTERIRTEHNCVPRDVVSVSVADGRGCQVAGLMLFGYNVFIGLKPETSVDDVFSLHRFTRDGDGFRFTDASPDELPGLLDDPRFRRDFAELYRYYRDTRLLQLRRVGDRLLAVFQTGARTSDTRVLRWRVGLDGSVEYLDNRGERDHVFPPSHDFEWTPTTREDHVLGRHPHISIGGEVFVETVGGDLTIKVENNTETGEGVYTEPVDEPLQSLADADVHHARVGPLVLMRIRPYNEAAWRHLVFNTRTKTVTRLDGIGQACHRLPEDQGLIFPGGYHLATGVGRTFDTDVDELEFERVVRSPNGEDVLYVFHARREGRSLLLPYNVIRKQVANPLPCHGFSLFDDGTLVVFRASSDEPTRVHPMQVWQTPYLSDAYAAAQPVGTGPLERVGNADLVRGVSDCLSVSRLVDEMGPSAPVFEDLIASCARVLDAYHWLGDPELGDLREPLVEVRATAERVLDEFEAVRALTEQAAEAVAEAGERVASLVRRSRGEAPAGADAWVRRLAELRGAQGRLVTLKEVRYADLARIDELVGVVDAELASTARRAVEHLRRDDAFAEHHAEVEELAARAGAITTAAGAGPLVEELAERQRGLEVLTEVVGSLDVADATVRTSVLERIGEVLAGLNRARAVADGRRRDLLATEGRAEFAAEFALLGQAVTGALAVADTPEACDEQLGRLLLRLEDLESRFGEFDDFLARLAGKRGDVHEAFSARRQALLDERTRRADRLFAAAERVLASVAGRVASLGSLDEVNTYFASDPMVARVRSVADELRALGEQVRAEELDGRVLAARQEAGRALRDRRELFDGDAIRLGGHRFAVNPRPLDLTLVPRDGEPVFAITGTDYRAPVRDPAFAATRPFWDQPLVSETDEVYRAEHLAASVLAGHPLDELRAAAAGGRLADLVRRVAESRLDEGYERGVHDHDAALVLDAVLRLHAGAGVLRYPSAARAAAQLFWAAADEGRRAQVRRRAASLGRARAVFGHTAAIDELCAELSAAAGHPVAGEYLFEELCGSQPGFAASAGARALVEAFHRALAGREADFDEDLRALPDPAVRRRLVEGWYEAFLGGREDPDLPEAVALELCRDLPRHPSSAQLTTTVEGLLGTHPRVVDRSLEFRLDELLARTREFRERRVPAFREYQRLRDSVVAAERDRLRLDEYRPRVMGAFVRNRLIDEVYLPLIGDNLAKQLGASGGGKRVDQMGLLLLTSPPGYGKTTLMEYVANRLGLLFVKVNGPALGHGVTSVDPADAPNATARQEVEKISFALEAGNNVLLYLDDIQHTSPELLQKFISLCDAQRRMEGVWEGRTRTYDLRGKRFAVCMAGNPYTGSGQRFRVPDMLANRADAWNLGDVLSGREDLFALSYVENALTSNPVLAPLSTRDRGDVELLVRLARGEDVRADRLAHPYRPVELEQVLSVLRKLVRAQEVVLAVNRAYIASAARSDDSRTEPPFLLQGSYRDMNKLAEKIVPVMNDAELSALIDDHYLAEAQTLAGAAEANLLKLAELRGALTPERAARWAEVKAAYRRTLSLGTAEDDPTTRTVNAIAHLTDRLTEALSHRTP